MQNSQLELAFYYPGPVWRFGDWSKNLLPFFDGIALLVPGYLRDAPFHADQAIAYGMQERGLLKILEPETFIDQTAAEEVALAMVNLLASGALDALARKRPSTFREL